MTKKIGRNDICPCGSGLKYKKCCLDKETGLSMNMPQTKEINKTFQYMKSHESEHILNAIIGLQLTSENHGKNIRIEELSKYLIQHLNRGRKGNLELFKNHLNIEYAHNHMEDSPENLFCENVVFYGGNFTVFPGISTHSIEIFRNLTESIFTQQNNLPDTFKNHVYQGITLILCLGELLAKKVNLKGCIDINDGEDERLKFMFNDKNFAITQIELAPIFLTHGIKPDIINDFIIFPQDDRFELEDADLNPLLYYPLVKFNDKYFFILISNQIGALNEYILRLSEQYNCNQELVKLYHDRIWHELWGTCDKMHWELTDISIPKSKIESNFKERIFQFDVNRLAYVCYCHNTKTTDKYNENDVEELSVSFNVLNQRIKEVINSLKSNEELKDYQFLSLITISSLGRNMFIGFEEPQSKELRLVFSVFPFIQLASTEKWNHLSLWKFAKSYALYFKETRTFSDTLDIYSIYKAKGESFYLSDDVKSDFLMVVPGDGSHFIKESKLEQNLHGAIAYVNEHLAYIPVVKSANYAPLYKPQYSIGYYALCLETFEYPIWISNKQIENKSMYTHIQNYAEAIGFWLYKLQREIANFINEHITFPLEIELVLDEDIFESHTAQELRNTKLETYPYSFCYDDHKIKFHIHSSSLSTLIGSNNEGERMIMFNLLLSFNQIEGVEFSQDFIIQSINKTIPLGNAKMILMYDTQKDLQTDPRWLIQPLSISNAEVDMLLDELPNWVEKEYKIPEKIKSEAEKNKFFNLATKILLQKLVDEIQAFDNEYLLNTLVNIHETLVWTREHNKIIIPAQLLCFNNQSSKAEEIQNNEENLVKTTLSLRCLIEYLTASPTHGRVKASYDDIDRLLVLMHEIINYGFLSDAVHFEMANPEVGKLKSGRIGISKEFFDEKIKPFAEAYTKENIDKYIQHFDRRFEIVDTHQPTINEPLEDEENRHINETFLKDWGIGYFNIIKFCYSCAILCIEGQSSIITLKEEDLIKYLISNRFNIPEKEVIAGIKHFSLFERADFLVAPDGFNNHEVFPWKYNREFSFGRRFIVKYKNNASHNLLKWGFRNAIAAQKQLNFLLFEGKLNNGGKEIEKLLGLFRERKGKLYRDEVKDWLKSHSELVVIDYEVKISPDGHLKADKNYGDIDILAYNKSAHTILSLECKDTNKAKNIHEMKKEMDSYLGRDGKDGMVHKHINRHKWLNDHKQDICTFLGINGDMTIKSYMLTSEIIPTAYIKLKELPLPIIAYPNLQREGLNIFSNQ